MILDETATLSNGVTIPRLGFGTWMIDDAAASQAVQDAIAIGYRSIDTAQAYGNERGVGEGIRASGVPRDELFVTTKLDASIKDHDSAVAAIRGSLDALGLDRIDLMLIHSPQPWDDFRGGEYADGNRAAWRALEEAYADGLLRSIGVSNFEQRDLDNVQEGATVTPQVNQILVHVGNTPTELIAECERRNILVESYSPIGHGAILRDPDLVDMAERYGVSVPRLCIRYTLQLGTVALPKSTDPDHMRENADVDFEISDEDMATLRTVRVTNYRDELFGGDPDSERDGAGLRRTDADGAR
ncbi:aldo/keto reductase [Pseudoclavibacter chungangensis]|uniref:Aldo/keto reductase n=1 Tax=Pseudoclavibacter chungangensis TaxID=587635 RepID=A0A7J5BZA0_9MICO|nr:aldo/keto reductase [Pseudoclavibacter chungangensis]KAB1659676.1 aldo/keto reductase [Pseudoclavibacter chungangensis]NYJ67515.1 diketogulonate reductase-like aldo/keto reductase [Pseudoclavibacter chungangensis]